MAERKKNFPASRQTDDILPQEQAYWERVRGVVNEEP